MTFLDNLEQKGWILKVRQVRLDIMTYTCNHCENAGDVNDVFGHIKVGRHAKSKLEPPAKPIDKEHEAWATMFAQLRDGVDPALCVPMVHQHHNRRGHQILRPPTQPGQGHNHLRRNGQAPGYYMEARGGGIHHTML